MSRPRLRMEKVSEWPAAAKAGSDEAVFSARLKACSDTKLSACGATLRNMWASSRVMGFLVVGVLLLSAVTAGANGSGPQSSAPATESTSAKTRVIGRKLQEKGVPNFGEVTPTLYRGGLLKTEGLKTLAKMGIKVVVDTHANDESEEKTVKGLGMEYVAIPWHCPWPRDEVFAKFLKVLRENQGKKVFVHCRLGDDRTGMMIAAYRMADEGWTADEAMNEMRAFGFTRAHHYICPGLASYEKHFPERLKDDEVFAGARGK
jgi:tyrosine-protein phosphatase SIW14